MQIPAKFVETVCGGSVTEGRLPGHVVYSQPCVTMDTEGKDMGWTTVVEDPDMHVHASEVSGVAFWYWQDMLGTAVVDAAVDVEEGPEVEAVNMQLAGA